MKEMKGVLTLLGILMILAAIGLVIFGGYTMMSGHGMVLGLLLWLAATDLICAVCGKTLIKPGPIAESMYPLLKKGRRDEFS